MKIILIEFDFAVVGVWNVSRERCRGMQLECVMRSLFCAVQASDD